MQTIQAWEDANGGFVVVGTHNKEQCILATLEYCQQNEYTPWSEEFQGLVERVREDIAVKRWVLTSEVYTETWTSQKPLAWGNNHDTTGYTPYLFWY